VHKYSRDQHTEQDSVSDSSCESARDSDRDTTQLPSKSSKKERLARVQRTEAVTGGEFILYKRRWLMLLVFCSATFAGPFFQMSYAAIANVVHDWYQVSYLQVNLLAMAYMICAIPFTFVCSFMLEKVGVRLTIILGLGLFVVSGWIRFYATYVCCMLCCVLCCVCVCV
jgi:Na+/melibiose symporter-like transporter